MTETTTDGDVLKLISHSIAAMMVIVDLVTVFGWTFDYVWPTISTFPQVGLTEALTALGVLTFLVLMQAFFLPLIVVLFEFPADEL
jgi:type III secretory pathway component EscU